MKDIDETFKLYKIKKNKKIVNSIKNLNKNKRDLIVEEVNKLNLKWEKIKGPNTIILNNF